MQEKTRCDARWYRRHRNTGRGGVGTRGGIGRLQVLYCFVPSKYANLQIQERQRACQPVWSLELAQQREQCRGTALLLSLQGLALCPARLRQAHVVHEVQYTPWPSKQ